MSTHYSESEVDQQEDNWDDWSTEEIELQCLFCKDKFDNVNVMFAHCNQQHLFNFLKIKNELELDFYMCIKLINFIREKVSNGFKSEDIKIEKNSSFFNEDKYLCPVLEDDALLYAFEDLDETMQEMKQVKEGDNEIDINSLKQEIERLKKEVEVKDFQFKEYKELVYQQFYQPLKSDVEIQPTNFVDINYFDGYSNFDIHEEMIKDVVRTKSYHDFIVNNKEYFKDKIVMDVGCGTGILSMFAAKAGAKKVYAIDNSNMIYKAQELAQINNFDQISFIKGKMEEIQLPVDKVDIIISEWMGYFLLFEAMLDTILYARDKYLVEGGLLVPNYSQIILAGFSDQQFVDDKINYWKDVYGLDFSSLQGQFYNDAIIDVLPNEAVISDAKTILNLDLSTIKVNELEFTNTVELSITKDTLMHGIVGYFDILFSLNNQVNLNNNICPMKDQSNVDYDTIKGFTNDKNPIAFSTGPKMTPFTHWKQTIMLFKNSLNVIKQDIIQVKFECKKDLDNSRALQLFTFVQHYRDGNVLNSFEQKFSLV